MPLFFLILQTLFFWLIAVMLYSQKKRLTLIPIYVYIGILTVLTHNLSDLGFAVVVDNWFFLISSFSLFTTLMFSVLNLYVIDGPRAGRMALWIILSTSFFYILLVYLIGQQADVSSWIVFDATRARYYFWSVLAVVADIIFLAVSWEVFSRKTKLNLLLKVFFVSLGVLVLDTLIFSAGVFWQEDFYWSMLRANISIRFVLALVGAPLMAALLKNSGYSQEKNLSKSYWEILNFKSDLEVKINTLEDTIQKSKALEKKLRFAEEKYKMVIDGVGAGIWEWDIQTGKIIWSAKFCQLLSYKAGELNANFDDFKKMIHPEDKKNTLNLIEQRLKDGKFYEIEHRLKTKSGKYRWFQESGVIKFDQNQKPLKMVGSAIEIDSRKQAENNLQDKIEELTKLNEMMVGRELKMIELKEQINQLKIIKK